MANFRCERVFISLDEAVPGLNHFQAVNPEEFADLFDEPLQNALVDAGVRPLVDFLFAPFERPKWRPAAEGLASVRAAIGIYEARLGVTSDLPGMSGDVLNRRLATLGQAEAVLDAADTRDRRFFFQARDLA